MASPNVILIGYRGCGKTTVGRVLAGRLSARFVDTDDEIAGAAGMSIADIFASEGDSGFRRRESAVVARLALSGDRDAEPVVVSLGGGAVLDESGMTQLSASARIVWLTCPPEILRERMAADETTPSSRPALTPAGGLKEIEAVLARREPFYRRFADLIVASENRSPAEVAGEIVVWMEQS